MDTTAEKLYDRSIRTWGAEAQQRLLSCQVLVLGYDALMSEILKNIVISGVSRVRVVDTFKGQPVQASECDANNLFGVSVGHVVCANASVGVTNKQRTELAGNVRSVNTDLDIAVLSPQDITPELVEHTSVIVCTSNDMELIHVAETFDVPVVYCSSLGGIGLYYTQNVNGHTTKISDSIMSLVPDAPARRAHQQFVSKYNQMDTHAPEQCLESMKAMVDDAGIQFVKTQDSLTSRAYLALGLEFPPVTSVIGSLAAQEVINIIGRRATYTTQECGGFLYDSVLNVADIISTEPPAEITGAAAVQHHHIIDLD